MLDFSQVPLFAELGEASAEELRAVIGHRQVIAGTVILRRGAPGGDLLVIAGGSLKVQPISGSPRLLGPGEIIGEMSLVSGTSVSATVSAVTDSALWVIPGELLQKLIDREPSISRELLRVVTSRLRRSESSRSLSLSRRAIVIVDHEHGLEPKTLALALRSATESHGPNVHLSTISRAETAIKELANWRSEESVGTLLISLPVGALSEVNRHLLEQDGVIAPEPLVDHIEHGAADLALYRVDDQAMPTGERPWSFELPADELRLISSGQAASHDGTPRVDRLARWIARKEVGVALGAGAARGFAHLGVLAELEALGLPIDRIAGTSMGGIAGLLYGLAGNGERSIELAHQTLGRRGAARFRILPRSSFLSDAELRRRARAVAGERSFADLPLPVAVVATDLLRGERVIIDRGSVAAGFFATSAVPGVLPPVKTANKILVDGALVARIPVDLLPPARCGLRIAVNVLPSPLATPTGSKETDILNKRMRKLFGFREVLSRSWNHLGWNHGARDAADADVLLEPRTEEHSSVEFASAWRPMIEAGRRAVREHADELRLAAAEILSPPRDH